MSSFDHIIPQQIRRTKSIEFFYTFRTVHLRISLVDNQLDAQFLL